MEKNLHKKHMKIRTLIFLLFMTAFFGVAGFMTYYSKVTFLRNLPVADIVDPVRTETMRHGHYTYLVPQQALRIDENYKTYLLAARFQSDILGERYIATKIYVWVLEKRDDGFAMIEGIVREEPVLTGDNASIKSGTSIAVRTGA